MMYDDALEWSPVQSSDLDPIYKVRILFKLAKLRSKMFQGWSEPARWTLNPKNPPGRGLRVGKTGFLFFLGFLYIFSKIL